MTVEKFDPNKVAIEILDNAQKHLAKQLADSPDSVGIRFTVTKTGCSGYSYVSELMDAVGEADIKADSNTDLPVYIAQKALELLNGIVVDFVEQTLGQKSLTYMNPNETGRCGCGISFSVDKSADEENSGENT